MKKSELPKFPKAPLTIKRLCKLSHATSVSKGWHETSRTVGDCIALMHSELSEALEEHRKGIPVDEVYYGEGYPGILDSKPEGIPIELADVVIRIADFCGEHGIDLEDAIRTKMAYNETRPHRHGGKKL